MPPPGTLPAPSSQGADGSSDSELSDALSTRSVASVRPGVSYSQAAHTNVGADTGLHRDQEADPRSGADTVSPSEREAYPRSTALQSGTVGDSSLSASDKENIIHSSISNPKTSKEPMAAHGEPEDKENGPWTEVHRHHKYRSCTPVRALLRELPIEGGEGQPSLAAGLSREQRHSVKAAEKLLTNEQHGRICERMQKVSDHCAASSSSRGEGPSTFAKGKAVNARNWGAAGINDKELDPDVQCREFEVYSGWRALRNDDSDADPDEQHTALKYWRTMKKAQHLKWPKATVHMDPESSDKDRDFVDKSSHKSLVI